MNRLHVEMCSGVSRGSCKKYREMNLNRRRLTHSPDYYKNVGAVSVVQYETNTNQGVFSVHGIINKIDIKLTLGLKQ